MRVELLRQADYALSKCGRPVPPPGLTVVPIYRGFRCWATFATPPASQTQTVPTTIKGDTTWMLCAISSYLKVPVGISLQFQFPDGKFLFSNLADIRSIGGWGSWRYTFTKERPCPPGTKILATFADTTPATAQAVPLMLEGAYYYHLKGAPQAQAAALVSDSPRWVKGENQNIFAPCWMTGEGPQTPQGFEDDLYTYQAGLVRLDVGSTTPKNLTTQIQIERGRDFEARRLLFNVTADSTVRSGQFLVKARTASGFAFCDDYIETSVLNGTVYPKDWHISKGDLVYLDFNLVDATGTGNMYVTAFLEGSKRGRV